MVCTYYISLTYLNSKEPENKSSGPGLVALAVRLIPPHNSYHDLKTGVRSEDIVGGGLSPNNINVTWITGQLVQLIDKFESYPGGCLGNSLSHNFVCTRRGEKSLSVQCMAAEIVVIWADHFVAELPLKKNFKSMN